MEKIQIELKQVESKEVLESIGLPATIEYKNELAQRCEAVVTNYKEVLRGNKPSQGEGAYTRLDFIKEIIDGFDKAEIVFFAMAYLEDSANKQVKSEAMIGGLENILEKLETEMRAKGIDVDALKAELDSNLGEDLEACKEEKE